MAEPMNGAVQGVATTVAVTPAMKDPSQPSLVVTPPIRVKRVPSSNTPNRLMLKKKNRAQSTIRKGGGFRLTGPERHFHFHGLGMVRVPSGFGNGHGEEAVRAFGAFFGRGGFEFERVAAFDGREFLRRRVFQDVGGVGEERERGQG